MKIYSVMLAIVFSFPTSILSQVQFIPHTVTFVDDPRGVYAADVDGDGDMDLLSACGGGEGGNEIAWYENDGNENFTHYTITLGANGGEGVYAIDVDDDGDMDVLSASVFDNKIAWYENDGNESFTEHVITSNFYNPNYARGARGVYAIDVDGDGDMDVLSAATDIGGIIAWYENDGNEYFDPHIITNSADGAWSVYAEDVDGDGDMDVLSASNYDDKIAWYENDGNENFTTNIITTSADWANSVYAIDVDGDGNMDVLSASFLDGKIAWYQNDGNENFISHTIASGVYARFSVYAADLDDDGDIDVISNGVAWYENDGNENFTTHPIGDGCRAVYAVDIDGDGDIDVLSDKIVWYENLSPHILVEFDIKPQSCPNPLNVKDKGNIPVAILGKSNFDVVNVDPTTILFEGVAPIRWAIEDITTPVSGGEQCDCTTDGPDGFADLTLKFDAQEIIAALGSVKNGDELVLTITGKLRNGTPIEGSDCVIIKAKGNLGKSSVSNLSQLSEEYALYENFPNPFSQNTTIRFAIPEQTFIKLEVYNSLGEKVTTLTSEEFEAGTYSFNWNAKNLPGGVYFYRIEAGYPSAGSVKVFQQVKKMTLLR